MSIGPAEIIIVLVIALLVFGPKRLPQMGKSLGKGVREFRKAAETAKSELGLDGVTDQINEVKATFTEPLKGVTGTLDDLKSSVDLKSAIEAPVAASAVAAVPAVSVPNYPGGVAGAVDEGPETPAITPQTAFADVPQAAPVEPELSEVAAQMGFSDVPQAPEQPEAAEAPPAPESPDGAVSPASPSTGD